MLNGVGYCAIASHFTGLWQITLLFYCFSGQISKQLWHRFFLISNQLLGLS
ncbi:MAG TPA: hypothetical protein V6C84_07090 [Coleofasciculaceae cyanobacterium]